MVWSSTARALPQRTLVARPLPPAVLAATAGTPSSVPTLSPESARALTDSLLAIVSQVRELKPLRPVPVQASSRSAIRTRLEEIVRQDGIETNLRQEEKLLRFLGLVPANVDLVKLHHDLLEEQLAGFYDIDRREMVLADWLPRAQQGAVMAHELTHALQDQHFSLRVRKRLGFESSDAEAAWHALIEGDATAVMAEMDLAPLGKHFTDLVDSSSAVALAPPAARAAAGGYESEQFRAAPQVVREDLSFPYRQGLRYAASLYRQGGWKAVDAAFVHPPASTEQVLHPDRIDNAKDAPVRVQLPDLRGMLGDAAQPVATGTLGEHEIYQYLRHYVDPEVARIAAEGWGGCAYVLYDMGTNAPPGLLIASVWDSEDDAVEFFGGIIGALESRYPNQQGDAETSSQDQVMWNMDGGRRVNVLRLRERQVVVLEGMPAPRIQRILGKVDIGLTFDDPTPEMRARAKDNLPWNRKAAPRAAGALNPSLTLPVGWTAVDARADSNLVLAAERGAARLRLVADHSASRELGLDGYAHTIANQLQQKGKDVYVQTDINFPRGEQSFYQHVFTQTENGEAVGYYIGTFDLVQGLGYLLVSGPTKDDSGELEKTFLDTLRQIELVPENAPASAPGQRNGSQPSKG
jgi:hypothetical protein